MRESFKTACSFWLFACLAVMACESPNPKACANHPDPDKWCGQGMFCFRNSRGSICRPIGDAGGSDTGTLGGRDGGMGGSGGRVNDGSVETTASGGAGGSMPDADVAPPRDVAEDSIPDGSPDVVERPDAVVLPPDAPVTGCTSVCTAGKTQCSPNGVQTCVVQSNGCYSWGDAVACSAPQICPIGKTSCECVSGGSTCTAEGAKKCGTTGLQTCIKNGSCFSWSGPVACPAPQTCTGDSPSAACSCPSGGCTAEGAKQCADGGVQTCTKSGACLSWSTAATCAVPQVCTGNAPSSMCSCPAQNACSTEGATQCTSAGAQTCTRTGACLSWSAAVPCSYKGCEGNKCATSCPIGRLDSGSACEKCDPGDPCCAGNKCWFGGRCVSGTCRPCGQVDQRCCESNGIIPVCTMGTECGFKPTVPYETCNACGVRGQACCTGAFCGDGSTCVMGGLRPIGGQCE
jgi:hypothetical protein